MKGKTQMKPVQGYEGRYLMISGNERREVARRLREYGEKGCEKRVYERLASEF